MSGFTELSTSGLGSGVGGAGYGYGGYGGLGFGGTALAAGAGAAIGSALFGNGFGGLGGGYGRHGGYGCDGGGERVVQINENGGKRGWGCEGDWWTFKEISDDRREQVEQTVSLQHDLFGIQKDILGAALGAKNTALEQTIALNHQLFDMEMEQQECCCETKETMMAGFNQSNILALQNKYDNALQLCNLQHEMEECCCKTNENITVMGYQTQIRDLENQNCTNKQLEEIKCLIKETENREVIRDQAEKINMLQGNLNKNEIVSTILQTLQPPRPIPAYAAANPFENFIAPVRVVERDRDDRFRFDNRGCCGF